MANYTTDQVKRIRNACAEARAGLRAEGRFEPVRFAEIFVALDGVQIPGESDEAARSKLATDLLAALREGRTTAEERHLARELARAHSEARWAEMEDRDEVVGMRLELPGGVRFLPACAELLKNDRGLGPGVFRKAEVVVLPPDCDGASFVPVHEYEVEQ